MIPAAEFDGHARPACRENSAQEYSAGCRRIPLSNCRKWIKAKTAPFLAAALAIALFWPSLKGGFLGGDDMQYVTGNADVVGAGWGGVFSSSSLGYYHPLTPLSFRLERLVFGLNPAAYHATNIALHAANCTLLYRFVLALEGGAPAALAASLLFAAHPLRAESVCWISGRKDLLCCFFLLAMLTVYIGYVKSRDWRGLAASCLLFALAMLSKPTAAAAPFALVLVDWRLRRGWGRVVWAEKILFLLAGAAMFSMSFFIGGFFLSASGAGLPVMDKLALCGRGLWFYLAKTLWPARLSVLYPHFAQPEQFAAKYLPLSGFAALLAAPALLCRRKNWEAAAPEKTPLCAPAFFGLGFFALLLLPALPFPDLFPADRYTYIPAAGIFLLAGAVFARFYGKAAITCAGAVLLACCWLCSARVNLWLDGIALCDDAIAKIGNSADSTAVPTMLANRGAEYFTRGQYANALGDFTKAIELNPSFDYVYGYRGAACSATGDYARAEADYTIGIKSRPRYAETYVNRGKVRYAQKKYAAAMEDFAKALELKPRYGYAYYARASVLAALGRHEQALEDVSKALELEPSAGAWRLRAAAEFALGRYPQSAGDYGKAIALEPSAEDYLSRGCAVMRTGGFAAAEADMNEALRLRPDYGEAYVNRGIARGNLGRHGEALADFDRALSLNPGDAAARNGKAVAGKMLRGR
ncbi:MAG: tetratricopeptide repeat protein [Elusimicrobiales bacterium]